MKMDMIRPRLLGTDSTKTVPPQSNETEVLLALSKIKRTAFGPDLIFIWIWKDYSNTLAPVAARSLETGRLFSHSAVFMANSKH